MPSSTMILAVAIIVSNVVGAPILTNRVRQSISPTPTTTNEVNEHIDDTGRFGLKIGMAFLAIFVGGSLLGSFVYGFFFGGFKKKITRPTQNASNSYKLRDMGARNGAGRHWPQPSSLPQAAAGPASASPRQPPARHFPSVHRAAARSPIDWAQYDHEVEAARKERIAQRGGA